MISIYRVNYCRRCHPFIVRRCYQGYLLSQRNAIKTFKFDKFSRLYSLDLLLLDHIYIQQVLKLNISHKIIINYTNQYHFLLPRRHKGRETARFHLCSARPPERSYKSPILVG